MFEKIGTGRLNQFFLRSDNNECNFVLSESPKSLVAALLDVSSRFSQKK